MQGMADITPETKQVVLVVSEQDRAIVAPVLNQATVLFWDQTQDVDFSPLADHDVILFAEVGAALVWMAKPAKLRVCSEPIPATFTAAWARDKLEPYPPTDTALRAVQPYNSDSESQKGQAARPPNGAGPSPDAALSPSASEPSETDLQAILGDSGSEPMPEVPEWVEDGPDADLPRLNGHNGHSDGEKSSIWVAPQPEEWALPVDPFSANTQPAEMNPAMLPAWMHDKAADDAQRIGGDVGAVVLSMLTSFSALIDDRFKIQVKQYDTWYEQSRLWGLCLGDTSTKKNALMEAATSLLQRINQEARKAGVRKIKEYADACDEYQTRRKQWISENAKLPQGTPGKEAPIEPEPIEQEWFICEDFTPQALGLALQNQTKQKIFILGDEPSVLAFDRFSGGKESAGRQDFLSLYQGRPRGILRVGNAERSGNRYIESWSASMNIGSTPSSLRQMLGPVGLMQDGLLQRCLTNIAKPAIRGVDRLPDAAAQAAYERACRGLFSLRAMGDGLFKQSPEGSELFAQFEDYVQRQTESGLLSAGHKGHIGKWPGMAPRLALTLFMACEAERGLEPTPGLIIIDAEYMRIAIDLLTRWQGPQIQWLWDGVLDSHREVSVEILQLCEAIAAMHMEGENISLSQIGNSCKWWKNKTPSEKARLLATLQDMNWIGRNPAAHQQSAGVMTSYKKHPALRRLFDQHPVVVQARDRRMATGARFAAMREASRLSA